MENLDINAKAVTDENVFLIIQTNPKQNCKILAGIDCIELLILVMQICYKLGFHVLAWEQLYITLYITLPMKKFALSFKHPISNKRFLYNLIYGFIFGCAHGLFSSLGEWGLLSSCGTVFSSQWLLVLQNTGSRMQAQ